MEERPLVVRKASEACPEGEKFYALKYPDVKDAVARGVFPSHFAHYMHHGKDKGKKYPCEEYKTYIADPTEYCPEGEKRYAEDYPEVKEAVDSGVFESHFAHYLAHGKGEGKKYLCLAELTAGAVTQETE